MTRALLVTAEVGTLLLVALIVAVVQVTILVVLHRVAHHLEPWPPRPTAPVN